MNKACESRCNNINLAVDRANYNSLSNNLKRLNDALIQQRIKINKLKIQINQLTQSINQPPPSGTCTGSHINYSIDDGWGPSIDNRLEIGCNPSININGTVNNIKLGKSNSITYSGSDNVAIGEHDTLAISGQSVLLGATSTTTISENSIKLGNSIGSQNGINNISIGETVDTQDGFGQICISSTGLVGRPSANNIIAMFGFPVVGLSASDGSIAFGAQAMGGGGVYTNSISMARRSIGSTGTVGENIIAIGFETGLATIGTGTIAIGYKAVTEGDPSNGPVIAIGTEALFQDAENGCIGIGTLAGSQNAQLNAIAIGNGAASEILGSVGQQTACIAVGDRAGRFIQGVNLASSGNCIAIGRNSGDQRQNDFAIAIGAGAGPTDQGTNSIAIGKNSGSTIGSNTIAINSNPATSLSASGDSKLYIADISTGGFGPLPLPVGLSANTVLLGYNTVTKEIVRV